MIEQFLRDLLFAYYQLTKRPLNDFYLHQLVNIQGFAFARLNVTNENYPHVLKAFLKGLLDFAEVMPPCLFEGYTRPLFSQIIKPNYELALKKLARPSIELLKHKAYAADDFEPYISDYDRLPPSDAFPNEFRLKEARAKYYEREDEKRNAAWDALPPEQRGVIGTPYYDYYDQITNWGNLTDAYEIPEELWYSSTWVCAPQGKGKTNLLLNLIEDRRKHGTVFIMDAKGELAAPYYDQTIIAPDTVHINPFDLTHSVELLEYVLSSLLETKLTPLQSTLFSYVVSLKPANLSNFLALLNSPFPDKEYNEKTYTETRQQLVWRTRLLLRNPSMAKMLDGQTTFSMKALMDSGKIIVIDNNPDELGDVGAEFFGRFILALMWAEVRARSRSNQKHPVYVFLDEAQTVISRDENIPRLIHQCRSQNVALIFAHQELQQMKTEDVKGALTNCAIRLAAPDGEEAVLAPRLRTDTDFLRALPKYHFAACLRDRPTVAVSVPRLVMSPKIRPTPKTTPAPTPTTPSTPAPTPTMPTPTGKVW